MHPLVGRAVDAAGDRRGDVLSRLHILQPHGRGLEGLHPARVAVGVDLQVSLSLVLLELPVVGIGHPALVQTLVLPPHFGDLKLVGDVIALHFHCLEKRQVERIRRHLTGGCPGTLSRARVCGGMGGPQRPQPESFFGSQQSNLTVLFTLE